MFKFLKTTNFFHAKHGTREPDDILHEQLEGCNRNLRPKAAVAKVFHDKDVPFILYTGRLYGMYK